MVRLVDSRGQAVDLGAELGAGGEGTVYEIQGRADLVAKIYRERPDATKVAKLEAMIRRASPELIQMAAWPVSLLRDSGVVVGFLMPRAHRFEYLHRLFDAGNRERVFPGATWALLVRAAKNLAKAFQLVHSFGHVIGDVNERNLMVSHRAEICCIDCDSMQIVDGRTAYFSDVGVDLYTPPELQGRPLAGVLRNASHDGFGLAVMIYQLLFMGRHPFAGSQAMTIDRAIREGRWASLPSDVPGLNFLPRRAAALFERAFTLSEGAARVERDRPTAQEWVDALAELESQLRKCDTDAAHVYPSGNRACPWCALERRGAPPYFVTAAAALRSADLEAAWREIEAVAPPKAPVLDAPGVAAGAPLPAPARTGGGDYRAAMIGTLISVLLFFVILRTPLKPFFPFPALCALAFGGWWFAVRYGSRYGKEFSRRTGELERREAEWDSIADEWESAEREVLARFIMTRNELEALREEFIRSAAALLHPDPALSPLESRAAEERHASSQRAILDRLRAGPSSLAAISDQAARCFAALLPRAREALSRLSRARADAREL